MVSAAWIIAAFLPLPPKPKMAPEMMEAEDDVEVALESQLMGLQQRRHDNARWWRNLNRWMISLGVVIIVVIVSFAAFQGTEANILTSFRSSWLLSVLRPASHRFLLR